MRSPHGPTSIVIKKVLEFFSASCKKNVVSKKGASVQTSASSFDSLQSHLDYEQHDIKTSQESIYNRFRRD